MLGQNFERYRCYNEFKDAKLFVPSARLTHNFLIRFCCAVQPLLNRYLKEPLPDVLEKIPSACETLEQQAVGNGQAKSMSVLKFQSIRRTHFSRLISSLTGFEDR